MLVLMLSSCYQHRPVHKRNHNTPLSEHTIDSLSFFQTHHYTNNYNFVVRADSLVLLRQMPEEEVAGMETDSFSVYKGDHVAVADIKIVPADSIDSVWVQLANDTSAFGWTHEKTMLPRVMPDDPISQFISAFSDSHLIIFLIVVGLFGASYLLWKVFKKKTYIVHFHDIDSVYPTLLCIIVASAATLYATLQLFAPQLWQHFYFHPSLNPFSVPPVLMVFLLSVWAMLIVGIACVDDIYHKLLCRLSFAYSLHHLCLLPPLAQPHRLHLWQLWTATQAQRPLPILWSHERLKHPDFPRVFQEMIRPPW